MFLERIARSDRSGLSLAVAAVEGAIGFVKAANDLSVAAEAAESLIMYLDTLRAVDPMTTLRTE